MRTPRALSPLRHRPYRWLASALAVSMLGQGLWLVAVVWQVVGLGGGPADLSLVTAAAAVGLLGASLLGGVLADRVAQRRMLIATELARAAAVGLVATMSLLGVLQVWQLALVSLLTGVAGALYYPAYSALLPSIVPADDLMPANGLEGVLRPVLLQAAGPALAGVVVAAASPGAALVLTAATGVVAAACLAAVPSTAVRRDLTLPQGQAPQHPVRALLGDLREGAVFMLRTRWLLTTSLFASAMILVMMGPLEVLVPFAVKDRAGGGPEQHALVLAAFGVGGAMGSLVMASLRMPRRYLSAMNLMWGLGCLPLVVFGTATQVWSMVAAAFVAGLLFNAPMVIWGTLLQRRVPPEFLGRVSSLDFFVSLAFMPVSMALAGPVSALVGLQTTFLVAGVAPLVIAVVALVLGRLPADEIAHPLDRQLDDGQPGDGQPAGVRPAVDEAADVQAADVQAADVQAADVGPGAVPVTGPR